MEDPKLTAEKRTGRSRSMAHATQTDQDTRSGTPKSAKSDADLRFQVRSLTIVSSDLPEATRLQIAHALQGKTYSLQVLSELVRQQLRDRRYLEAKAEIQNRAGLLASAPTYPVDISVRVSAGAQYTLGGIVVQDSQAISKQEILKQFPIRPGDLFNATEIAEGLDRLKKLYASRGYIHFGPIPTPQIDEKQHTVTLTLEIIEGERTRASILGNQPLKNSEGP
jgi:outer membrane protein assembly factor BamA